MLKRFHNRNMSPRQDGILQATISPLLLQRLFLISDLDKILTSG